MILENAVKSGNVIAVREILKTASLEAMDEPDNNGRTPLMLACFRGNIDVIKLLVKSGAGTHCRDRWGKTALMYAVQRGHVDSVKFLLKIHADASARDNENRCVEGFARPGTLTFDSLVELLQTSQLEFQESRSRAGSPLGSPDSRVNKSPPRPVTAAAEVNATLTATTPPPPPPRPLTVHDIVRRGILPDIKTPPPADESLVKHGAPFCNKDPLELARRGMETELKAILPRMGGVSKFGLNQPNDKGRTPLMVAILNGKLDTCLIIIKAGGEINGRDFTGKTVLFYAIAKRNMEAVCALIAAGADAAAVDKFGRTPLMQACMDGNAQAARAVLKAGVSLAAYDNKGRTALMYAVSKGNIPTIQEIVSAGADPSATDHSGKRVEQFALTRSNYDKISPILSAALADWKASHPTLLDQIFPETGSLSFQSPPQSPDVKREEGSTLLRDDSFFGSPSRAQTAGSSSGSSTRKRVAPLIASPFNPKANRSTIELVRIGDYIMLDAFLDGCSLMAVNERDKKAGRTALMVAVLQQKMVPMKMLLEAGADIELKDNQGKTALAHAAATRNIKSINMLLEAGACLHTMDDNGRTPLDQAELGRDEEVVQVLSAAAAAASPKRKAMSRSKVLEEVEQQRRKEEDEEEEESKEWNMNESGGVKLKVDCD